MRTKEGVGRVAPPPVRVALAAADLAAAQRTAWDRAAFRRYDRRPDAWGRGCFDGDPVFPVYVGCVGELAVRNWAWKELGVRVGVDTTLRKRGDGDVDLVICGYGVQVKTAYQDYSKLLLRTDHVNAMPADEMPVKWDVCVRIQWPAREPREKSNGLFGYEPAGRQIRHAADILGVVWRDDLLRVIGLPEPGKFDWWNYAVKACDFLPVSTLADKCNARILRASRDLS